MEPLKPFPLSTLKTISAQTIALLEGLNVRTVQSLARANTVILWHNGAVVTGARAGDGLELIKE